MASDTDRFDAVLAADLPAFESDTIVAIAAEHFGIDASAATDLGSERDQAFELRDADQRRIAIVKVSNAAEDPEILDMEALVVRHAALTDPDLPIAAPHARLDATDPDDPASYRAAVLRNGQTHWARAYALLPGTSGTDPRYLSDGALHGFGTTTARLGRALRGFFHPRAKRRNLWDPQHAALTRPFLPTITDAHARAGVTRVLDRFDDHLARRWPALRAQVIHTDISTENTLLDTHGRVSGIFDFGDMSHTALAVDVATLLEGLTPGRTGDERFRVARLIVDGYQRLTPLDDDEVDVLGELWATRCAVAIAITSWRIDRDLADPAFAHRNLANWVETIDLVLGVGWPATATLFTNPHHNETSRSLRERRDQVFGPAIEALSYDDPLHVVAASGVWMTATDGRRYLDAYNNVPCVGHGHPRVTTAIDRQARRLNTNLRYLHGDAIELAERLTDLCPPGLDTVFFVNSGTEANDLAWRIATVASGNEGGLCTEFAYHGVSAAMAPFSRETWPATRPSPVESWEPADAFRGEHLDPTSFDTALARLEARGLGLAATILDGVVQSDGVLMLEPEYVQSLVARTHAAGGFWIADEVQGGHGRTGESMWSFERFGIVPDFVTLGKPMGNGHPVAAVITRRELAARFAAETSFFSTFGGNPVSVAAALAVLDVIEDERIIERTRIAGSLLRHEVSGVAARHPCIGDVRGVGLANGIEIVDPNTNAPDAPAAGAIVNGLRANGVLVGSCGRQGNVLKVRPPLAFTADEVPVFAAALAATLEKRT